MKNTSITPAKSITPTRTPRPLPIPSFKHLENEVNLPEATEIVDQWKDTYNKEDEDVRQPNGQRSN